MTNESAILMFLLVGAVGGFALMRLGMLSSSRQKLRLPSRLREDIKEQQQGVMGKRPVRSSSLVRAAWLGSAVGAALFFVFQISWMLPVTALWWILLQLIAHWSMLRHGYDQMV